MENTVKVEKLLQEIDEKLENEETLCYMKDFYSCLNKTCNIELDVCKRGRTSHGGYLKAQITYCKKQIQQYKDEICLLRLDLQIKSDTDEIKYKIIRRNAWIFYEEVFEKMCTFEFSNNDFITEKWIKELCEQLVNRSDFYAQKAVKMFKIREIRRFKKTLKDADKLFREIDEKLKTVSKVFS